MGRYIAAGMASGFGQGVGQGLINVQQSILMDQRIEAEKERLAAMQEFEAGQTDKKMAQERDLAGAKMAQDRAMHQENLGARLTVEGMQLGSRDRLTDKEIGARDRLTDKEIDARASNLGRELDSRERLVDRELGAKGQEGEANRNLEREKIRSHEKVASLTHDGATKAFELSRRQKEAQIRDQLVEAIAKGDTEAAPKLMDQITALSGKPGDERRTDAINANTAMRTISSEIDRLEANLSKLFPEDPRADSIQRDLDRLREEQKAYSARVQHLTGTAAPGPKKYDIKDPFK